MEIPFKLADCNVYSNGADWLGKAEVELPEIKHKSDDLEILGVAGSFKFADIGNIEAMTGKIKFKALNREALIVTLNPADCPILDIRGAIQQSDPQSSMITTIPVKVEMKVQFAGSTLGTWKKGDGGEPEAEFNVFYLKIEMDGNEVLEFDPFAYIYKVNGTDLLQDIRTALGK